MSIVTELEKTIITSYVNLEYFNRATTAHLEKDFFESDEAKILMGEAIKYSIAHQNLPTKSALKTIIQEKSGIREAQYQSISTFLDEIYTKESVDDVIKTDSSWLLKTTESWCKERSVFNAIIKSLNILDGKVIENRQVIDKSAIPEIMQKALSISFDSSIGHDYLGNFLERYNFLHSPISKIPFKSNTLNRITGGGIERKSITILVCPPHAGKTLTMASWSADWLRMGYNILVISLEMAEMKIGERIDANLLNVDIGDLKKVPQRTYEKKFNEFAEQGYGKMLIKEYPMSTAGASHFRFLLQELEIKQGFIPDVVVVDYMGICISSRYKSDNMYQIQKAVGEELRGLAQEKDFALVTAVQTNKNGYSGDFDMGDISESSGHAMTGDFILGLVSTPELIALGQVRVNQLKNRWGSIHDFPSFLLNMDRKKMRVWDSSDNEFNSQEFRKPVYENKVPQLSDNTMDTTASKESAESPSDDVFVFNPSMIKGKRVYDTDSFQL